MSYISKQGIAGGPLKLQYSDGTTYQGTWIVPSANPGLKFTSNLSALYANDLVPLYATTPTTTGTPTTANSLEESCVATVAWVRSYVTAGSRELNLDLYVNIDQFEPYRIKTLEAFNLATEVSIKVETLTARVADLESFKTTIIKRVEIAEQHIDDLDFKLNSHIDNPFPDGVIFIAGNAEGV